MTKRSWNKKIDSEFEVEQILDSRMTDDGRSYEYLIRWKDFGADEDTWEPEKNLAHCKSIMHAYLAKQQLASFASSRSDIAPIVKKTRIESNIVTDEVEAPKIKDLKSYAVSSVTGVSRNMCYADRDNFVIGGYNKLVEVGSSSSITTTTTTVTHHCGATSMRKVPGFLQKFHLPQFARQAGILLTTFLIIVIYQFLMQTKLFDKPTTISDNGSVVQPNISPDQN